MAQSVSQKQQPPNDTAAQRAKSRKALERLVATDPQMRQAAREAASKAGISIGEFLNRLAEQMDGRLEMAATSGQGGAAKPGMQATAADPQPSASPDAPSGHKPASKAPYGAARAMMGELKERVDYVERAMGHDSSDRDVADDGRDERHWSDRLEDMARQIERSEQYMIGGLMTVEEVMANLAERTRVLEKNKANANKLAQLMESFAAQFFVYRDDTDARLASIDSGLSHLTGRVDELASNGNHKPSSASDAGRGRLSEALDHQAADDAHWGTTENPGLNRLKRFSAERTQTPPEDRAAAPEPASVHADDLIDPPSVGAVEIGGIQYSLPVPSGDDDSVDADLVADDAGHADEARGEAENRDTSLFDPARQLTELDDDDQTMGFEDLSSDTALRNFLKRTREQGDYSDDFDTSYDDQEQRTVHMRGVIAVVVGFAFLALVAAAYLLMMDMGPSSGPRLNPNEPGLDGYSQEGAVSSDTFPESSAEGAPGDAGEYALYGHQDLDELSFEGGEDPLGPPLSAPESMTGDTKDGIASATDIEDTAASETLLETASLANIDDTVGGVGALSSGDMSAEDAADMLVRGVRLMTGVETERDPQRGAQLIRQAAAAGSASAQYHLGALYEQGLVVKQDYQKAVEWYSLAAEAGNRKAMHNLAVLYTEGMGVVRDYRTAAQWFEKAANLGLTDSQYNLGILYARGLGVAEDPIEAYKWFEVLARTGDTDARKKAEGLAAAMDPDTLDVAIGLANRWQQLPLDPAANNEAAL